MSWTSPTGHTAVHVEVVGFEHTAFAAQHTVPHAVVPDVQQVPFVVQVPLQHWPLHALVPNPPQQLPLESTAPLQHPVLLQFTPKQHCPWHTAAALGQHTLPAWQSPEAQQEPPHEVCPLLQHKGVGEDAAHVCPDGQQMPPVGSEAPHASCPAGQQIPWAASTHCSPCAQQVLPQGSTPCGQHVPWLHWVMPWGQHALPQMTC
jgi:hypothetical protein